MAKGRNGDGESQRMAKGRDDHRLFHSFPHHTLFFSHKINPFDPCNACRSNCYKGFSYKCIGCSFILDVKCALLNPKQNDNTQKKKIEFQQPNHPHPLILCNEDKNLICTCSSCDDC